MCRNQRLSALDLVCMRNRRNISPILMSGTAIPVNSGVSDTDAGSAQHLLRTPVMGQLQLLSAGLPGDQGVDLGSSGS